MAATAAASRPAPFIIPTPGRNGTRAPASNMPTVTVLRVKRRRDEDPMEALVIGSLSQRSRLDDQSAPPAELPRMFRLVETVPDAGLRDRDASRTVRARLRDRAFKVNAAALEERKQHLQDKRRQEDRKARFRVVSRARGMPDDAAWSEFRMYDLDREDNTGSDGLGRGMSREMAEIAAAVAQMTPEETAIACNYMPMVREYVDRKGSDQGYVYDLYCQFHAELHELETFGSEAALGHIESFNEDLVFDDDLDVEAGEYDDESDSNDESNWRNDYPDEESTDGDEGEHNSGDEEDVQMRAMESHMKRFVLRDKMAPDNVKLTGDDDMVLSSDDEEDVDELIYGITIPEVDTLDFDADSEENEDDM